MRTAKLVLSILGVSLATLSFGQLLSLHETKTPVDLARTRILETQDEVLFYIAEYNAENGRTIHWVNHQPDGERFSSTNLTPLVQRTYFARQVEALYEEIPVVETWMTTPFRSSLEDSELGVEDWMCTPFDSGWGEEALEIEPWMTSAWI